MKNRIISCVLAFMMAITLLPGTALAAESTKASSMVLSKTEGTVTVKNASGKKVTVRQGGRIYKGYQITTGEGYAWITLDENKSVKLDWDSSVTVKKSGKKIELLLNSGSLFFDVAKPLEEDEDLNIRTSTMFTGIRGTIGTVSVERVRQVVENVVRQHIQSRLTVLEGAVEVSYSTPETPADAPDANSFIVAAGQQGSVISELADGTDPAPSEPVQQPGIVDTTVSVQNIGVTNALTQAPYVAKEVAQNVQMQERIVEAAAQPPAPIPPELTPPTQGGETPPEQTIPEMTPEEQEALLQTVIQEVQKVLDQVDTLLEQQETQKSEEKRQTEQEIQKIVEQVTQQVVEQLKQEQAAAGETSAREETTKDNVFTETPSSSGSSSSSSGGNSSTPSNPSTCEVFFLMADGVTVFARATIPYNTKVDVPVLMPTNGGFWHLVGEETPYDFDTAVTEDLTLVWDPTLSA